MAILCNTLTEEEVERLKKPFGIIRQSLDIYKQDEALQKMLGYSEGFRTLIKNTFHVDVEDLHTITITPSQALDFKQRIQSMQKAVHRGNIGNVAVNFFLPRYISEKQPFLKEYFQKVSNIAAFYHGAQDELRRDFEGLYKIFESTIFSETVTKQGIKNPLEYYTKLEEAYKSEIYKANHSANEEQKHIHNEKASQIKLAIDHFLNEEESGKIFGLFVKAIEGDKESQKQLFKDYPTAQAAIMQYNVIMDKLYKQLSDGFRFFEQLTNKRFARQYPDVQEKLNNISETLKNMRPQKKENYFPHFYLFAQLAPYIDNLNNISYGKTTGEVNLQAQLDSIQGILSGHTQHRISDKLEYSENVLPVIKRYMDDVLRFNYVNKMCQETENALSKLADIQARMGNNETFTKYLESLQDFILATHSSATGLNIQNNFGAYRTVKVIQSFMFMSKLGGNVRTSVRNIASSVGLMQEFGFNDLHKSLTSIDKYSVPDGTGGYTSLRDVIQQDMESIGILFKSAGELHLATEDLYKQVTRDKEGNVVEYSPDDWVSELIAITNNANAKLSRLSLLNQTENTLRRWNYTAAFMRAFELISSDKNRITTLKKKHKGSDIFRTNKTGEKIKIGVDEDGSYYAWQDVIRFATQIARTSVYELQGEYTAFAKPRAAQSPVGSALYTFQNWTVHQLHYQGRVFARGIRDLVNGVSYKQSDYLPKMARGIFVWQVLPLLLNLIPGAAIGNLIQNDAYDKLETVATGLEALLTGDDKKLREKTKQMGLITQFPTAFTSDLITYASLANLIDLSDDNFTTLILGKRDFGVNDFKKGEVLVKSINTEAGRLWYNTIPAIVNNKNSGIWQGIANELGIRSYQKKLPTFVTDFSETYQSEIQRILDILPQQPSNKPPYILNKKSVPSYVLRGSYR